MHIRRTGLAVAAALLSAAPAFAADPRADFWRIIDRPRVDLAPVERPMPSTDPAVSQSHVTFTSEPGQPVPTWIEKPTDATGRLPVVIVLHGTGGTKEGNRAMMDLLLKAGFMAVAPDGRYHGERSQQGHGTVTYYAAIAQAYRDGKSHPWLYDTVFDVTRLIDYLQTRPDVDAKRIGLMGFSKGGMETYLAAAIDPRVAAAVPCISVQDFRWELDHDQWHHRIGTVQGAFDTAAKESGADPEDPKFVQQFYDRVVPGIDGEFDCPAMLPLIAPRPLLAVSGEDDPINPLPSAQIAAAAAKAAYAAAGAADRFTFTVEPKVAHDVKPKYRQQIADWFAKQLIAPTTRP
jgi:dienelactone hydrolase